MWWEYKGGKGKCIPEDRFQGLALRSLNVVPLRVPYAITPVWLLRLLTTGTLGHTMELSMVAADSIFCKGLGRPLINMLMLVSWIFPVMQCLSLSS